jgi:Family of unknown function (DUF6191)
MTQWGIETLFNPSKRHADEEKRRLQATREVVGDSSGGRKIDLESGTVRISRPKAAEASRDGEASQDGELSQEPSQDAESAAGDGDTAAADSGGGES